jgi:hypothetical protein|tara:strand:- start:1303 stop:1701 length:399 start_codon:yes stop_codon:yes gene_type:complete
MGQWVSNNWNNAAEYECSGTPWCLTVALSTSATIKIKFPTVTRWIQVINNDSTATNTALAGFSENGVNSNPTSNYFVVNGAANSGRLELRCVELFLKAGAGTPSVSIIAGVTQIPHNRMFSMTGSSNISGVG